MVWIGSLCLVEAASMAFQSFTLVLNIHGINGRNHYEETVGHVMSFAQCL